MEDGPQKSLDRERCRSQFANQPQNTSNIVQIFSKGTQQT
jgi:hypothetical protein